MKDSSLIILLVYKLLGKRCQELLNYVNLTYTIFAHIIYAPCIWTNFGKHCLPHDLYIISPNIHVKAFRAMGNTDVYAIKIKAPFSCCGNVVFIFYFLF
jgi:hypothetical protein